MSRRCRHLSVDAPSSDGDDVATLVREFERLEELQDELSLAQRWAYGRLTEVLDRLHDRMGEDVDGRFHADVLAAVVDESRSAEAVAEEVDAPPEAVEDALRTLADRGLVTRDSDGWRVKGRG